MNIIIILIKNPRHETYFVHLLNRTNVLLYEMEQIMTVTEDKVERIAGARKHLAFKYYRASSSIITTSPFLAE